MASAIAYFAATVLFFIGVWGLYLLADGKVKTEHSGASLAASFLFFAAAWGCAYLGGI